MKLPEPITRKEMYLSYLNGNTALKLPEPITRTDIYLYSLCINGGGSGGGGTEYALKSEAGYSLVMDVDPLKYIVEIKLKNKAGDVLSSQDFDFPIETAFVDVDFNEDTNEIVFTLQNGTTTDPIDISRIVRGLVPADRTIAGLDLKDDITVLELANALGLNNYAKKDDIPKSLPANGGNSDTANKLSTPQTIDGVEFDGSESVSHFGVCDTSANDVSKIVDCPGFKLVKGASITVLFNDQFKAVNDVSPTLNVNDTGAKPIYYHNTLYELSGDFKYFKGQLISFIYDGDKYIFNGDPNSTFLTYAQITDAEKFMSEYVKHTIGYYDGSQFYIAPLRSNKDKIFGAPIYGAGIGWGTGDTHGYLMTNPYSALVYMGGGSDGKLKWIKELAFKDDITSYSNIVSHDAPIQLSDVNHKDDINDLPLEWARGVILKILPKIYKMKEDSHGRYHWGLISQDVEKLLAEISLTDMDFGGFIKSPVTITVYEDENGNPLDEPIEKETGEYIYALRPTEFIPGIIVIAQDHESRIDKLEKAIKEQQSEIAELKSMLQQLLNQ